MTPVVRESVLTTRSETMVPAPDRGSRSMRVTYLDPMVSTQALNPKGMAPSQPVEAGRQWRTKREIAEHFQCHVRTISKYMKRRILPFVKIGRWVRLDLAECDQAMEKYTHRSIFEEP